jgi:osmoprotectant transport system substrate-binding protein
VLVVVVAAACATEDPVNSEPEDDRAITIGTKNFAEQFLVGEMYALLLEDAGLPIERRINLGDTRVLHERITSGTVDIYPEYTGTALVVVLDVLPTEASNDTQEVFERVNNAYQERFGLIWLAPAPMDNAYALAMPRSRAMERDIATISDVLAIADTLILTGPPEFRERADGLPAVHDVYGDFAFADYLVSETNQRYQHLISSDADVVVAFGTDGEVSAFDLLPLQDDKGAFPPAQLAPVVREEVLEAYPQVADVLNALAPELTDETLRRLNYEVSGKQRDAAEVARDFLIEVALLSE